jgi:hypothetical protein
MFFALFIVQCLIGVNDIVLVMQKYAWLKAVSKRQAARQAKWQPGRAKAGLNQQYCWHGSRNLLNKADTTFKQNPETRRTLFLRKKMEITNNAPTVLVPVVQDLSPVFVLSPC